MYSAWFWLLQLAVFIWLGVLSFLIWQSRLFLRSLFPKDGERDIRRRFEEVVNSVEGFKIQLSKLDGEVSDIQSRGLQHIQRVELLRYNPYDDTGGDQSFTLALLDDKGTGFVISSLHARSGTRIFAKDVRLGKSSKYRFSKEEELVIRKAMTKN